MKTFPFKTLITLVLSFSVTAQTVGVGTAIIGFDLNGSEKQLALETKFAAGLKRENLREWMKRLSARPHHLGSAYGKENAEFMASLFRSWGYDAKTERFDVLFPTPKTRLLEMTSPTKFVAKLEEPSIAEDSTSGQKSEQLPTYNAFSVGGDVTGDVVYVNYGVPADYEELARRGISVKGKIALARYGGSWRGIKPKVAAENGAIACLIYSDPKDDGFFNGDVYPVGAWRNKDGVQRGSVVDVPVATGDPSTPGYGSVPGAKRLSVPEIETITKIPVMPISYGDAEPILRGLGGPVAPAAWRGALPITYKLGGQDALKVRFKIDFNWNVVPLYNVIAKLEGSEFPDEWIIRGNHHDAWVNGASDPLSGAVAELDEARAIGELAKKGWRPRRTIIYAMWDGEEQGLIGSTEWVETHAEELSKKAAVYINTDSVGRGYLGMGGSHSLERFINEVAKSVKDPVHGISVWDRARARQLADGGGARDLSESGDMKIGALGSGSDYTPFLQHLGIASLDLGFGGEGGGGSYHSIYDSFDHFTKFGDFDFAYGNTMSEVSGRAVLRLANADVLPFRFTSLSETVAQYAAEVSRLASQMRDETSRRNGLIARGIFDVTRNPKEPLSSPITQAEVPAIDFSPLHNALKRLAETAKRYDSAAPAMKGSRGLNDALLLAERSLVADGGLPNRPWYRHQIYAPGFYTGYGVKTLPGVREAIEQRQFEILPRQIERLATALNALADQIEKAGTMASSK